MTTEADRERLALLVHEVRSPTAALAAIASTVSEDRFDNDTLSDLIGLALAACRGIERVVNDAAPRSVYLEDVDLTDLAHVAVTSTALGGDRVRGPFTSTPLLVRGDPVRLRQALDNLIANAVAHSPAGSDVVVSATAERGNALLSVQDAGNGISAEDHGRIFDPGVRLDTGVPGSGLGLAVARAIAEAHGGTLTVQSSPGEGAIFTLAVPLGRR